MKHEKKGLARILAAFRNSRDGFKAVWKSEEAFRNDLAFCFWIAAALAMVDFTLAERLFAISALFFILFAELVNTAIEFTIDRISMERHPMSKIAKDIGSLLVLLSFAYFAVVWCAICARFF